MDIKKLRIFLWVALAVVVVWILWMNVVPGGKITYINDFNEEYSEFVRKLTPDERLGLVENGAQKIFGDPAYFELRVPRRFTDAKMIVKYKNNTDLPIVEAGVLMDKKMWQYNLAPLQNKILDNLFTDWGKIEEGESVLLQRRDLPEDKIFSSITDFKNNLPEKNKIALYNTDLSQEFLLPDYEASFEEHDLGFSLQGAYQFYTYLKDEDLNFTFDFVDTNKQKGGDEIVINLYYRDQVIDSLTLSDDGIVDDKGKESEVQTKNFKLTNLPEGLYRAEVRASNDIITKKIITTQSKISFINKFPLADAGLNDLKIFTDSLRIDAQTINPNSLQTIQIDGNELLLGKTYEQKSLTTSPGIKEINITKDGIDVFGNGVFALSEESLVNPQYRQVDNSFDPDIEGVDYILANYNLPASEGDWLVSEVNFDLANAYKEFSKHTFLISAPELRVEDGQDDYLEVDEIKIELTGTSLWDKILKIFNL